MASQFHRSVTCITTEDNHQFLTDSGLILQNLDVKDPLMQYVVSACAAFYKEYGFGIRTLLCMTAEIYKVAHSLQQQGMELAVIQKVILEGIEKCCTATKEIQIQIPRSTTASSGAMEPESHMEMVKKQQNDSAYKRQFKPLDEINDVERSIVEPESCMAMDKKQQKDSTDKMLSKQVDEVNDAERCIGDDTDDCSWFFDDSDPEPLVFEFSHISSLTGCALDKSKNFQTQQIKDAEEKDSDSEFDDCFDDIPTIVKYDSVETKSKSCYLNQQKMDMTHADNIGPVGCNVDRLVKTRINFDDSDDEFDQCFSETRKEDFITTSALHSDSRQMPETLSKTESFQDKLNRMMTRKKNNSSSKILNRSRHFKTMESTLDELDASRREQMDENLSLKEAHKKNDVKSLLTEVKKMIILTTEENSEAKQLSTKNKTQLSILNSSRHFKTIESTITAMEKYQAKEKPLPIDKSCSHDQKQSDSGITGTNIANRHRFSGLEDRTTESLDQCQSIARGLSHGCEEIMNVALQIAHKQTQGNSTLRNDLSSPKDQSIRFWERSGQGQKHILKRWRRLNASRIHCMSTSGVLTERPSLYDGIVIKVSSDTLSIIANNQHKLHRTVVVNGDITPSFHHKGYKSTLKDVKRIYTAEEYTSQVHTDWAENIRSILEENVVDVVIARGKVSSDLYDVCNDNIQRIFIGDVPYSALQAISASSEISMATYLTDIDEFNICTEMMMKPLQDDWMMKFDDRQYVVLSVLNVVSQTVIYSHPAQLGRDIFEQEFWRCCHTLSRALQTGYVLPGGSRTEQHCAETLIKSTEHCQDSYKRCIWTDLAEAFHNYRFHIHGTFSVCELLDYLTLLINSSERKLINLATGTVSMGSNFHQSNSTFMNDDIGGRLSGKENSPLYDEASTKIASWETAFSIAMTILQIDCYIQTGVEQDNKNHL